jgi:hypothetical protein
MLRRLKYSIDEKSTYVAAVIDFDGPSGVVVVDGKWMSTGAETKKGMYLYISSSVIFMGGCPKVRFISKVPAKP